MRMERSGLELIPHIYAEDIIKRHDRNVNTVVGGVTEKIACGTQRVRLSTPSGGELSTAGNAKPKRSGAGPAHESGRMALP
jgi:hypothetical protein